MDVSTIALGVLGGAAILALLVSVYTLLIHTKVPSVTSLSSRVNALNSSLTDLDDRVNHWMRRQNTRRLREKQEEPVEQPLPVNMKERKAALRNRVYGR